MTEVTKAQKIAVLNEDITLFKLSVYKQESRARVGKRAGNDEFAKSALDEALRLQELLDGLEAELKEVEKE